MEMQQLIFVIAAAVILLLLILILALQSAQNRRVKKELNRLRRQTQEDIQRLYYDLSISSGEAMRSGNDSLLNTLQSITAIQGEQLDRLYQYTKDSLDKNEYRISGITRTLDGKLDAMRHTVDEKLQSTLDQKLNESFSQVSARLEQVYKGLGEMQTLAAGVGDLKKVLTNVKTRGIWGEMQLSALLAQMLSPAQYEENVAVSEGQERVEFAVKLPGHDDGTIYLPIDSKFPQESYVRLVEAAENGDKEGLEASRKELYARLLEEGKRIASKYVKPPATTDFAIMFLPVEGLYAELMRDMAKVEELQTKHRVVVAGPSTLAALLNSLQMGFRTLAIEQRSGEVWQLLGAVKADFARFTDALEKTQAKLKQASDSIDSAFTQTKKIQRHLREVEALEDESLMD